MATQPLGKNLAAVNPGTAAPTRQAPQHPHRGATAPTSPNGARLQALVNIGTRRRIGTMANHRRLPEMTANLGKNLPAAGMNDHDADD